MKIRKAYYIIIFLIIVSLFCGCGSQKKDPNQMSMESNQGNDKVPKQLKEIENGIESVISTLNGPAVLMENSKKAQPQTSHAGTSAQGSSGQKSSKSGSQQTGSQSKTSESKQSKTGTQSKSSAEQNKPTTTPNNIAAKSKETMWKDVDSQIDKLHYKWNDYMPMAMKLGGSSKLLDDFSNALNVLTDSTSAKNELVTLKASNALYSYIPDFYSLYKTEVSPEIKRVRYYSRSAILNSYDNKWDKAKTDIKSLDTSWKVSKNSLNKNSTELSNKLDLSIYEFDKVIAEKNSQLAKIKGKILLTNIKDIEKANEKKSK